MKLMTFNSSCSFAAVANLLEQTGIEIGVNELAIAMRAPYLFVREQGEFKTGAMLQSARWFNLALSPLGICLKEECVQKKEVPAFLHQHPQAMLGLHLSKFGKHAVNLLQVNEHSFVFFNNHHPQEKVDEMIELNEEQLLECLDEWAMIAWTEACAPKQENIIELLQQSRIVLKENLDEIVELSTKRIEVSKLKEKMNPLFRPLFLDGIEMMKLIGEDDLAHQMKQLQSQLMSALRNTDESIQLEQWISMELLQKVVVTLDELMMQQIRKESIMQ